jgi:hypothetical protein
MRSPSPCLVDTQLCPLIAPSALKTQRPESTHTSQSRPPYSVQVTLRGGATGKEGPTAQPPGAIPVRRLQVGPTASRFEPTARERHSEERERERDTRTEERETPGLAASPSSALAVSPRRLRAALRPDAEQEEGGAQGLAP